MFPYTPDTNPPKLMILTPQNYQTCNSSTVNLSFNITKPQTWWEHFKNGFLTNAIYNVDGLQAETINITDSILYKDNIHSIILSVNLTDLSNGYHNVSVTAIGTTYYFSGESVYDYSALNITSQTETVNFFVNNPPPKITIVEDKTVYDSTNVRLTFTLDKPAQHIFYSLDSANNVTIWGNTTLNGLSNGSHFIVIYANDTVGNVGESQTIIFTISSPTPKSSPSATTVTDDFYGPNLLPIEAGAIFVIVAIVAGALVYVKKNKRNSDTP
jgi:hypothetical protein